MRQRRLTGINLLIRRDIDRFRRAEVAIRQGVEEVVEHPAVIERIPVRTEDFLKRQLLDAAHVAAVFPKPQRLREEEPCAGVPAVARQQQLPLRHIQRTTPS